MRKETIRTRAFTLAETMAVVMIVGTVAVLVYPSSGNEKAVRLSAATQVLASDIELAQVMSMTNPGDPMVIRFDESNASYWLANSSDPDTPIVRSDTKEPYYVSLGVGRARSSLGVNLEIRNVIADTLEFNAYGGLNRTIVSPVIEMRHGDDWNLLTVTTATGQLSRSAGQSAAEEEEETIYEPVNASAVEEEQGFLEGILELLWTE